MSIPPRTYYTIRICIPNRNNTLSGKIKCKDRQFGHIYVYMIITRIVLAFISGQSGGCCCFVECAGLRNRIFFLVSSLLLSTLTRMVGGFTLGDLLEKPWTRVSSLLPPSASLYFSWRIGFSIPTTITAVIVGFHRMMKLVHAFALSATYNLFYARKSPYERM